EVDQLRRRPHACVASLAPNPGADVPNRRGEYADRTGINKLSSRKPVHEDDAGDEREAGYDGDDERTHAPMSQPAAPHPPQRHDDRQDHQGPQEGVKAEEAQADRGETSHDKWNTGAAQRGENRTE